MAIRMRINKDPDSVCKVCGENRDNSVEMFDIKFTDKAQITICDLCMDDLGTKTIHMVCHTNHKVKTAKDMRVIRRRHWQGLK